MRGPTCCHVSLSITAQLTSCHSLLCRYATPTTIDSFGHTYATPIAYNDAKYTAASGGSRTLPPLYEAADGLALYDAATSCNPVYSSGDGSAPVYDSATSCAPVYDDGSGTPGGPLNDAGNSDTCGEGMYDSATGPDSIECMYDAANDEVVRKNAGTAWGNPTYTTERCPPRLSLPVGHSR